MLIHSKRAAYPTDVMTFREAVEICYEDAVKEMGEAECIGDGVGCMMRLLVISPGATEELTIIEEMLRGYGIPETPPDEED
jgi:hypothetical protein